jgi:hypothetical protein
VVSLVAVEPSGKRLPSTFGSRGSIGAEPSSRAWVSGALNIIAPRGLSTPRYSRDYHLIINTIMDWMLKPKPRHQTNIKSIPTTMKKGYSPTSISVDKPTSILVLIVSSIPADGLQLNSSYALYSIITDPISCP